MSPDSTVVGEHCKISLGSVTTGGQLPTAPRKFYAGSDQYESFNFVLSFISATGCQWPTQEAFCEIAIHTIHYIPHNLDICLLGSFASLPIPC